MRKARKLIVKRLTFFTQYYMRLKKSIDFYLICAESKLNE